MTIVFLPALSSRELFGISGSDQRKICDDYKMP